MEHKFVFIAGLHRSGTSLLHRMLCEYKDVSGFKNTGAPEDEGQHLQTVYKPANEYGGPGEFAFDHEAHMDETHPLANTQSYHKLMQEWGKYWDLDCPILTEKSPPNIIRSRFLQAIFPNSYFIFIRRHPIAVTMATRKWNHESAQNLFRHWVRAHQLMQTDIPHLRNTIQISYEELTEDPKDTMGKIERLLSLPKYHGDQEIKRGVNEHYFQAWKIEKKNADIVQFVQECDRLGYNIRDFI